MEEQLVLDQTYQGQIAFDELERNGQNVIEESPLKVPLSRIDEMLLGTPKEELQHIDISSAEIVRRQYLSHIREAILTIRPDGISFNNSCIAKMIGVQYIHILIDRGQKRLFIRACDKDDKDGQRWCTEKAGKRSSRKITGKPFCTKLYQMMDWSKAYYYKICGSPALQEGTEDELLFVFELAEYEKYPLTAKGRKAAGVTDEDVDKAEIERIDAAAEIERTTEKGTKKVGHPRANMPEAWEGQSFGELFSRHQNRIIVPRVEELEKL